jgi:putative hydrolase of HD superfamily
MFIVACYAYFFSLVNRACPRMGHNNFFAGLFHDLPELLTRDIISPVKRSVAQIGNLIREYEEHEVQRRVLGLLEQGGYGHVASRLHYFLGLEFRSEFVPTIIQGHQAFSIGRRELMGEYNQDEFDPKDGPLLKVCDSLAAFIEAYTAMRNGITTDQLSQAVWRIRRDYNNFDLGNGLHIGSLLADFD